jgi:hypothetical protein
MTDLEITEALERATSHLSSPPDLLDRVRVGGRRRRARRRTVLAAGLAAGLAGSTAGVWQVTRRPGGPQISSPLLDEPTRGDLRGDAAYLATVRATWLDHLRGVEVRGAPHVVWAGSLPLGGSVAAVVQRSATATVGRFTRPGRPPSERLPVRQIAYGWIGFVENGDRVISMEQLRTGTDISPVALTGAEHNQLVVLDDGRRIEMSDDFRYAQDGTVAREFQTLPPINDGAMVMITQPQTGRVRFALRSTAPGADGGRRVGLANYSALAESYGVRGGPVPLERTLPGWQVAWPTATPPPVPDRRQWDLDNHPGYDDPYGYQFGLGGDSWYIRGATHDRRPFVVQTLTLDDRRPRVFLIMDKPRFVGFADPRHPPIQARLPGDQGVVIAAEGAELCYRVRTGAWLPVGPDAALIPAASTQARATWPDGRSQSVPLN